jgi:MoaA/NifB/PqqE/SkfB family radical SAM enzyme
MAWQQEEKTMNDKASISQRFFRFLDSTARKFVDKFGLGNSRFYVFLGKLKALLKKRIRPTTLDSLDICVTEHCNLGCYSCNHFSQLAEPEFADLPAVERDLRRLSGLSGGSIPLIYLAGGEPLLNPELPEFMQITRQYFPKSRVQIVTNGLLLLVQKDVFWESVKKYNVVMTPTKYPGVDWEKIEARAREFGYQFDYFDFSGNTEKTSRKFLLDISGSQNAKKSFNRCCMAACTVAVQNGRVATCAFVFNMRHFNKYFGQNILVTEQDSIDIHKAQTMQEIVDFVNRPIPLCRYCKSMGEEIVGGWRKTECKITEWT